MFSLRNWCQHGEEYLYIVLAVLKRSSKRAVELLHFVNKQCSLEFMIWEIYLQGWINLSLFYFGPLLAQVQDSQLTFSIYCFNSQTTYL